MTETELVFGSMTLDELREAGDFTADVLELYRRVRSRGPGHAFRTEGPILALEAMQLAWLREVEIRYGAEPWEAGQPTDGHPARGYLDLMEQRLLLNVETRIRRPEPVERLRTRPCAICGTRYPVADGYWPRGLGDELSTVCLGCSRNAATPAPADAGLWDEGAASAA